MGATRALGSRKLKPWNGLLYKRINNDKMQGDAVFHTRTADTNLIPVEA